MFITVAQGAVASTVSSASASRLSGETAVSSDGAFDGLSGAGSSDGRVRHLLFGTLADVKGAIARIALEDEPQLLEGMGLLVRS